MHIAIYSRKSKLTETGESIQNQISMCKDYANMHFSDCMFSIYEDEGFSGGNTDRPMFKKLIHDAENNLFDILICYRLDRISRNVADFSETLELLTKNNISFVSIKEQFNTSSPMGKAMIYIASVFAQLERDTIAERITDNFTELAKTGRFLVGSPPEGLKLKKVASSNGKTHNVLDIVPEECEKIKIIYQKYLEFESNTKVQVYCLENNIRTKKGSIIRSDWITRILTHPLYAVADEYLHDYFKTKGVQITSPYEDFNGKYGITVFRRTKRCGGRHMASNDYKNWILGVGSHKGIIVSNDWITVQKIIEERSQYGSKMRKTTGNNGLFTGMLICGRCGDYMRPMCVTKNRFYYKCITKDKSRKAQCDIKDIRGDILDNKIFSNICESLTDIGLLNDILHKFKKKLSTKNNNNDNTTRSTQNAIASKEKAIKNLVMKLSATDDTILEHHISEQINLLDKEIKELDLRLNIDKDINGSCIMTPEAMKDTITTITSYAFNETDDVAVKRNLLKTIIKNIIWDGVNITVNFYDFSNLIDDEYE